MKEQQKNSELTWLERIKAAENPQEQKSTEDIEKDSQQAEESSTADRAKNFWKTRIITSD
jgi:hypothetical protein